MATYRIPSFTTTINPGIADIDLEAEPQTGLIFNQSDIISSDDPITNITIAGNIEYALEPYLLKSGGVVNGIIELNANASLRFSDSTQQTTAFSTTKDNLLNEHEGKIATLFNNDINFTNYNIDNTTYKTNNTTFTNQNRQRIENLESLNIQTNLNTLDSRITNLSLFLTMKDSIRKKT